MHPTCDFLPLAHLTGAGVEQEVAGLAEQGGGSFAVVVVQVNGEVQRQKVVSTLDVSAAGIALLGSNGTLRCQTEYNTGMQVWNSYQSRQGISCILRL